MSFAAFVSPVTKLVDKEPNATKLPSSLIAGVDEVPFPCWPALLTETRNVCDVCRSRTKMSSRAFVSPTTRLVDDDTKATNRPSALITGANELPFPWAPAVDTETRASELLWAFRTKISDVPFVSPATRLLASE